MILNRTPLYLSEDTFVSKDYLKENSVWKNRQKINKTHHFISFGVPHNYGHNFTVIYTNFWPDWFSHGASESRSYYE